MSFRQGSGRLCLDFVHTLRDRGTASPAEDLPDGPALAAWVRQFGPVAPPPGSSVPAAILAGVNGPACDGPTDPPHAGLADAPHAGLTSAPHAGLADAPHARLSRGPRAGLSREPRAGLSRGQRGG